MKAQRAYLYKDIAALERLVAMLLTHPPLEGEGERQLGQPI